MLTELDIVNDMLRATGTSSLTQQDTAHPAYVTADATLQRTSQVVQALGLWFNTTYPTFTPNVPDGEILIPSDTLHCDPVDTTLCYSIRGSKMYDLTNRTFIFTDPVCFKHVNKLSIEDMPYMAQDYVRAKAKFTYFLDEDGGEPKLSQYRAEMDRNDCVGYG